MLLTFCRSSWSLSCTVTVLGTALIGCSVRVALMVVCCNMTALRSDAAAAASMGVSAVAGELKAPAAIKATVIEERVKVLLGYSIDSSLS
jgi:hypothetical protein